MRTQGKIKTSEQIAGALESPGITHVLGITGTGNAHLFESIAVCRGYTEIVCVHHERAACMAVQTFRSLLTQSRSCALTVTPA